MKERIYVSICFIRKSMFHHVWALSKHHLRKEFSTHSQARAEAAGVSDEKMENLVFHRPPVRPVRWWKAQILARNVSNFTLN